MVMVVRGSMSEYAAEFGGQGGQGSGIGCGRFEVGFELACDAGAVVEAEHAERAGEFVGDGDGFSAQRGRERAGGGPVEQGEPLLK